MDLVTFGRTLCGELGIIGFYVPTGIWVGQKEIAIRYDLTSDACDVFVGATAMNKPEFAGRLFLRLFGGVPSLGQIPVTEATEEEKPCV